MKDIPDFIIGRCFDSIWEFWPNKDKGEHAPRKAVSVALKSGHAEADLIKACRIYSLLVDGEESKYIKLLHNFINGNEWMDILEAHSLEALERHRQEAIEVIEAWNQACRPHWNQVIGIENRIPIARSALQDKEFKKCWKKSLDIAKNIFHYRFNDSDVRSKVNLTFAWFTSVSPTKHTVLKLLEGDFGKPEKRIEKKEVVVREITTQEREKVIEDWKEVFGTSIAFVKEKEFKKPEIILDEEQAIKTWNDLTGQSITAEDLSGDSGPDGESETDDPYGFH